MRARQAQGGVNVGHVLGRDSKGLVIAAKDGQNNSCEKQGEMDRIAVGRRKVQ